MLSQELDAIVATNYPVYLGTLHHLLSSHMHDELMQWSDENESNLPTLAVALFEQLENRQPYALEVLTQVVSVRSIRDACLRCEPSMLSTLIESHDDRHATTDASVAFLAFELPQDVPLPTSAATLTLRLFDRLVEDVNSITVSPVISILSGVGPSVLDLVDSSKLVHFVKHVRQLLRSVKGGEADPLGSSLLAILGKIHSWLRAKCAPSNDEYVQVKSSEHSRILSESTIEEAFRGQNAYKTALFAIMQIILASNGMKTYDALHRCRLVECFFTEIEIDHITFHDSSKKFPWHEHKLCEKISAPTLDPLIRVEATSLACILAAKVSRKPEKLMTACEQCLSEVFDMRSFTDESMKSMQNILNFYVNESSQSNNATAGLDGMSRRLAEECLDRLSSASNTRSSHIKIMSVFQDALHHEQFRKSFMSHVTKPAVVKQLRETIQPSQQQAINPENMIGAAKVTSLLLTASILSQRDDIVLPSDIGLTLLCRKRDTVEETTHAKLRKAPKWAYRPLASREQGHMDSRRWQSLLDDELETQARQSRSVTMKIVGGACQDLQKRCDQAEQPWRDEISRHEETKLTSKSAHNRIEELERENVENGWQISVLQSQKADAESECAQAAKELRESVSQFESLRSHLEQCQRSLKEAIDGGRRTQEELKAQHQSEMSKTTGIVETQRDHLDANRATIQHMETQKLQHRQLISQNGARIEDLQVVVTQLNDEVTGLNQKVASLEKELELLRNTLSNHEAQAAIDVEELKRSTELKMNEFTTRLGQVKSDAQVKVEQQQMEIDQVKSDSEILASEKDAVISDLEQRSKATRQELRLKENENVKLQKKWKRMQQDMQNMFRFAQETQDDEPTSQGAESSLQNITMTEDLDDAPQGPLEQDFNVSFGSSSSSRKEPTPKRQKPRHSVRLLETRQKQGRTKDAMSPLKQTQPGRKPLQMATANRTRRRSLPPNHHKVVGLSPLEMNSRLRDRKSLAVPTLAHRPVSPAAIATAEKENEYADRDLVPDSCLRAEDLEATTEEFRLLCD